MADKIVNRLSELNRPSLEFPRHFVPDEINLSKWEEIEPLYVKLLERKLDSKEAVEQWLLDGSELGSVISEEGSLRYIAMTCATDDEEVEKAYLHFVENIEPKIKPFSHKLNLKLLESPHIKELDEKRYEVLIRSVRTPCRRWACSSRILIAVYAMKPGSYPPSGGSRIQKNWTSCSMRC